MPRRVKSKAKTGPKAVKKRPKGDGWRKVKRIAVESAQLIEVGPDHIAWKGPDDKAADWLPVCSNMFETHGAIVKLVPPAGTPESHVVSMERSFYEADATSVKVMPVQEEVVVTVEGETFDFSESKDERPLRQVVMERIDRATNSQDVDALRKLCTEAMDHAEA